MIITTLTVRPNIYWQLVNQRMNQLLMILGGKNSSNIKIQLISSQILLKF